MRNVSSNIPRSEAVRAFQYANFARKEVPNVLHSLVNDRLSSSVWLQRELGGVQCWQPPFLFACSMFVNCLAEFPSKAVSAHLDEFPGLVQRQSEITHHMVNVIIGLLQFLHKCDASCTSPS